MTPSGRRRAIAMFSASSTSSVRRWLGMAHPTTLRLNTSSTMARYINPFQVGTYVTSATLVPRRAWRQFVATSPRSAHVIRAFAEEELGFDAASTIAR